MDRRTGRKRQMVIMADRGGQGVARPTVKQTGESGKRPVSNG
ncbi:hypothetical protein [Marinibacterium sp. SX1]